MPDYILNDSNGLSNSNLALATAGVENVLSSSTGISKSLLDQIDLQEYDVIQGKKYIGSDGKLHTGSLVDLPNDMQCPVVTQYDPGTGFTYLALPAGAYRRTDGRMSPHPNIKRRLSEIMGEAGFAIPSGVIDVLGVLNDTWVGNNTFSKTIYSGYKSFVWVQYCDYSNGHLYPAPPSISSGSLSQVFSINGLGWIWVINNASMPFTISSRANHDGFDHQYILLLGVR